MQRGLMRGMVAGAAGQRAPQGSLGPKTWCGRLAVRDGVA